MLQLYCSFLYNKRAKNSLAHIIIFMKFFFAKSVFEFSDILFFVLGEHLKYFELMLSQHSWTRKMIFYLLAQPLKQQGFIAKINFFHTFVSLL